jgi:integrase
LRSNPGSTEFIESCQAAERGEAQREPEAKLRGASGTFDRLTHEYFAMASATFMADKIEDAGLPERCVTHGLRKAATRRLAEAGCSANEIAAITGHATLVEVSRYTKAAEQKRLAKAAIRRLERSQSITDSQTFPKGLGTIGNFPGDSGKVGRGWWSRGESNP